MAPPSSLSVSAIVGIDKTLSVSKSANDMEISFFIENTSLSFARFHVAFSDVLL
jgi:hypothetical protein